MPGAQFIITAALVLGCAAYALWTLMPARARRAVAQRLLRLSQRRSWPRWMAAALQAAAQAPAGCDCSGCDKAVPPRPGAATPIQWLGRAPRQSRR